MAKYICGLCGFVYDEADGDSESGVAAGTVWEKVPADYRCPVCGADKESFEKA
jgi:rubredoxin